MTEIAVIAWIVAAALAVVVLGFCAYELRWKARRLQDDLAGLAALEEQAEAVQRELAAVQDRAARARTS